MSAVSQELAEIVDGLPEEKAREIADFARFLKQQAGDREWERIIGEALPRLKLDAFAAGALREGKSEPFDMDKL